MFVQSGSIRARWLYSGESGCIRAKVGIFCQKVVFGEKEYIRSKTVVFGQSGCIRSKVYVFVQIGC